MRTYLSYLITLVIGLAAGALPFLLHAPDPQENQTFSAYRATDDQKDIDEELPAALLEPSPESGQTCEETLELVRDAHALALEELSANKELVEDLSELMDKTSSHSPLEFPSQLDEAFQPEQFQQTVEQLMEECPDVFPAETNVDCSEYPCAIEFPMELEGEQREAWRFDYNEACPALSTHFGHSQRQPMVSQFGDETRVQLMAHGTGIGLDDHLNERRGKLQQRIRERWRTHRREMATELYEDACLEDLDTEACQHLSNATWGESSGERELYLEVGCEADDAGACNNFAWERCYGSGQCDATAEEVARRAVELEPEDGNIAHTLGVVLCQRGQVSAAAQTWQAACAQGHDLSCTEICGS